MSYLLDTNILSELLRQEPDVNVRNWMAKVPSNSLYISVLTLGEIRKGIEKLEKGNNKLLAWLEHDLPKWFGFNVLSIDKAVADRWGYLTAMASTPLAAIDSLLAATALTHNLKMVTRNVKDFNHIPGLELINPFQS